MARKLTEKQERFVEEYLIDLNATQACIRAGYSQKNADKIGSELLGKTREQIDSALAERSKRTGVNQDRVLRELARIAFVKITDVIDADGEIRSEASDDDLACIESVKIKVSANQFGENREIEVKLSPKLKALELLAKHLGMLNDKLNVDVNLPVFYEGEEDLAD